MFQFRFFATELRHLGRQRLRHGGVGRGLCLLLGGLLLIERALDEGC
jgi:hypothetical protein